MNTTEKRSPPALLITKEAIDTDPAFSQHGRGARKLCVTELYQNKEEHATAVEWIPMSDSGKCPVLVSSSFELAIFNEKTPQDKHYHKKGGRNGVFYKQWRDDNCSSILSTSCKISVR